jgi:hypothetical protein
MRNFMKARGLVFTVTTLFAADTSTGRRGHRRPEARLFSSTMNKYLTHLIGRIKLVTRPASRCFLVALFIFGFTSSYVANLPSMPRTQNSATPDMGNHPPKPAFDLSRGAIADASGWDNLAQLPQQDGQTVTLARTPFISDDLAPLQDAACWEAIPRAKHPTP